MRNMWRLGAFVISLSAATMAFAFGEPQHSSVAVDTKSAGEKLTFDFKIEPNKGMAVNFDAPWALEIKTHEGLTFAQTKLSKDGMDEKLPGFSVTTSGKPAAAKGELEYRLTSFICTEDKTQCFREVHKGKAAWATPQS